MLNHLRRSWRLCHVYPLRADNNFGETTGELGPAVSSCGTLARHGRKSHIIGQRRYCKDEIDRLTPMRAWRSRLERTRELRGRWYLPISKKSRHPYGPHEAFERKVRKLNRPKRAIAQLLAAQFLESSSIGSRIESLYATQEPI